MNLQEARAAQLEAMADKLESDALHSDAEALRNCARQYPLVFSNLEADYALLAACVAAIEAQTVECEDCRGDGYSESEVPNSMSYRKHCCETCNGKGRIVK
jgi:hypothetical protein